MFLCISIFPGRRDEFAGQCREQMVYSNSLFDPPPCPDMNPFCLELGVRKKCFPFMWFLKPLPICLASVGSRSVGFLPSPTVRLDFRLQFVSRRGESRLHLYSTLWNLFRFKGVQEEKLVGFPSLNMIADGIIFFDAEY